MRILRTDEARFAGLPDYPFAPHYLDVASNLRMHFVDEGPRTASPVLMLHGEPSWSYLYRHMIPLVAASGHRVLAPDLIGFGKSDKPADVENYSYERHMAWLSSWLEELDLNNITLVCQNWGSLLGLRLAAEHSRRFSRIIVGNGMLPTGEDRVPTVFSLWKAFCRPQPLVPDWPDRSAGYRTHPVESRAGRLRKRRSRIQTTRPAPELFQDWYHCPSGRPCR